MPELRAGWAKREVTPNPGYAMAGYIARKGNSVGVLDPLYVRVLLLEQGTTRMVIVVADVLLISTRWAERLRHEIAAALKIRQEFIIVAATHTHSGPILDMYPFDFSGALREPQLRQYSKRLERTIIAVSREAAKRLCKVDASFAKTEIEGVASDRNRSRRARRQSCFVFKFDARKEVALFAVYGCHPTVLGADNRRFSGDLHGALSRILEKKSAIALVANGAAANISTRFTRKEQTAGEVKRLANKITSQIAHAKFKPLSLSSISARMRSVVLPLANLNAKAPSIRSTAKRRAVVANEGLAVRAQISRTAEFSKQTLKMAVTTWCVGPITFAALPWEIYSDTGEFLWKQEHVIPICYANGYWGYLPSAAAAASDYEVLSSPFARSADQRLRQSLTSEHD
jgi:neutral ceramidase